MDDIALTRGKTFRLVALFSLCVTGIVGQVSNAIIAGSGYSGPAPVIAAPGHVMSVFVNGLGTTVTQKVLANAAPWPYTLAGISAKLVQLFGTNSVPVPIGAVFPFGTCLSQKSPPCGTLTGVLVQIPFELVLPPLILEGPPSVTLLVLSDEAGHSAAVELKPIGDQIHILHFSDTVVSLSPAGSPDPIVTHTDGSLVSSSSPARIDETIVMYAVGLGATRPPVKTGDGAPFTPAVATGPFALNYDYRPNVSPSVGTANLGPSSVAPRFAGLAPGFVGLYSANVLVLAPPTGTAGISNCGGQIHSNLTITLVSADSFDGAAICVAVGQ